MDAFHQTQSGPETARRHLRIAEASATKACELGSDVGCRSKITVLTERNASTKELRDAHEKAFRIAEAGCIKGDLRRCELAIKYARSLRDDEAVKRNLARRCELKFKASDDPDQFIAKARCTGALILGLTEQEVVQKTEELSKAKPVLRDGYLGRLALEPNLISGSFKIDAPPAEAKLHDVADSTWSLCVSETGMVTKAVRTQASPEALPLWEKKIAETMATWRFRPILVDGEAKTVCTVMTFTSFSPW